MNHFRLIIGFTISLFLLVIFNESWLFSTAVYLPCLGFYMYKTGYTLLGSESEELVMRIFFCSAIYAVIAYRVEILTKQSFMGRETSEKAFHRWMKIFETFPEGIALIRNNYILCGNKALQFILNVGIDRNQEEDPLYNMLKVDLKKSIVRQWVKTPETLKTVEGQPEVPTKQMSIWQFLMNNEKGAIFQLLPKERGPDDKIDVLNEYLSEIPKYITLNQVNVKIAGGTDKLLVVRDVTSIVMNEQIMETKKDMSKLTDLLMNQVEVHTKDVMNKLEKLDVFVQDQGKELIDETYNEVKNI